MRIAWMLLTLAACSSTKGSSSPRPPSDPWPVPSTWKHEAIPFPLDFAPDLHHRGVEELRFAPGMFDPKAPGRWSYTFVWRTDDDADMDASGLAAELTAYFRGLLVEVDGERHRFDPDGIVVDAAASGNSFTLSAHIFDAFGDAAMIELSGTARRTSCAEGNDRGALWTFVLAPPASTVRGQLDELSKQAACGQPLVENRKTQP